MTHAHALALVLPLALALSACAADDDAPPDSPPPHTTLPQITGEWTLVALDSQPLADDVKDRPPTFAVNDEGRVSGFAGVNRYFATLDLDKLKAGTFDVSNLGMTRMAGPPARMQLEQAFTQRLVDADRARMNGDALQLTLEGKVTLTFERAAAAPQPVTIDQLVGDWTLATLGGRPLPDNVKDRPPTLTVDAEGKIAGFAGVNRYFGAIDLDKLKQGEFATGPIGMTMMAGEPERMDLEKAYTDALDAADRAALDDDGTLQLTTGDDPQLTFTRTQP